MDINFVIDELTAELKIALGDKFRELILYGSYARGDFDEWSDVDLMILVDIRRDELVLCESKIIDISTNIGIKYNKLLSVVMQNDQFFEHWTKFLPFYENVRR